MLNAVFFQNLTVASGDFDVIKRSLTRLTGDRRIQALLVALSFGPLIEGIAGYGAPVTISCAILASLGFEPVTAAVLALLANTSPVAFGRSASRSRRSALWWLRWSGTAGILRPPSWRCRR